MHTLNSLFFFGHSGLELLNLTLQIIDFSIQISYLLIQLGLHVCDFFFSLFPFWFKLSKCSSMISFFLGHFLFELISELLYLQCVILLHLSKLLIEVIRESIDCLFFVFLQEIGFFLQLWGVLRFHIFDLFLMIFPHGSNFIIMRFSKLLKLSFIISLHISSFLF